MVFALNGTVTLTFDLVTSKFVGVIYWPWPIFLPSTMTVSRKLFKILSGHDVANGRTDRRTDGRTDERHTIILPKFHFGRIIKRELLGTEQSCQYITNVVTYRGRYRQVSLYLWQRLEFRLWKNVRLTIIVNIRLRSKFRLCRCPSRSPGSTRTMTARRNRYTARGWWWPPSSWWTVPVCDWAVLEHAVQNNGGFIFIFILPKSILTT